MSETLEPEASALLRDIFEARIPHNKTLGLKVVTMECDEVRIEFTNRPELIGNYIRGTLHGGVISAVLDVTGGLVAFLGALDSRNHVTAQTVLDGFARIGTIDLRVDYLRPGRGELFCAMGWTLRTGNKVAVTRMELETADGVLVAVGTGTYLIG